MEKTFVTAPAFDSVHNACKYKCNYIHYHEWIAALSINDMYSIQPMNVLTMYDSKDFLIYNINVSKANKWFVFCV